MIAFMYIAALTLALALAHQSAPDALAFVKAGQKLIEAGRLDAAEEQFRKALAADAKLFDAHYALGRLLDLNGRYKEARAHFDQALAAASARQENGQKIQVWTAIAVSWAFEGKPDAAAEWFQRMFDAQTAEKALDAAAATANALARMYLESGEIEKAEQWYRTGYETARLIEKMPADQRDLWDFRWHHAQARIAARRGRHDEARAHAAAAKTVLDKGTNPDQAPQYPYLTGYLAFYAGDFRAAAAELAKADQADPFILGLSAQAYERLGNPDKARELYTKVLASGSHTLNAAFARPLATAYLAKP
jgi:tetratricopeptide (TPR) repeat protein